MAPMPISSPINVGHIDDVQELKKSKSTVIPNRFVRDVVERPQLPVYSSFPFCRDIPVIDLSKIINGNYLEFQHEISKLATSCEEWGFFQVINHGIEVTLLEKTENMGMDFFMLPLEEKQKYPMAPGTVQGYGQAFVFSEDQKLDWCNMFALGLTPRFIRNPKLWPSKPEKFSETLEMYASEIGELCKRLLRCIAASLGLNGQTFEKMFGEAVQAIRMNYYPSCPRPDLVLGLSPHSDGSALTILQQKKGSSVGLQLLKDNKWVSVQPIPSALVVNIGDTMEGESVVVKGDIFWNMVIKFIFKVSDFLDRVISLLNKVLTNGKYKSVEHRAVTDKEKDRLSIVTFYAPSYEVELGPMPQFVDESNPIKYKRYNHGEYSKHYVTNKLQGKRTLEFAKLDTNLVI